MRRDLRILLLRLRGRRQPALLRRAAARVAARILLCARGVQRHLVQRDGDEDRALALGQRLLDRVPRSAEKIAPLVFSGRDRPSRSGSRSQSAVSSGLDGWRQKCRPILLDTENMANLHARVVKRLSPWNWPIFR